MTRLPPSALAVSALSMCLGCGSAEPLPNFERAEQPIFGGVLDTSHDAVAALITITPDGQPAGACSSTIIATKGKSGILLTAAHCVVEIINGEPTTTPLPIDSLFVVTGNDWANSADFYRVLDVTIHAGYNAQIDTPFDIAVARYAGALASTPTIPILTAADDDITFGSPVTLVGYGVTASNEQNTQRYSVGQQVADQTPQNLLYDQTNGQGLCSGDSGGPTLYATQGRDRVAGVSSSATDGCEYGISVRVSGHASFINGVISNAPTTLSCDECSAAAVSPGNPCEDVNLACSDGSPCADFVGCADACTNDACIEACSTTFAEGFQAYGDVVSCLCNEGCATECAISPGCSSGSACGGLTSAIPTCVLCMQQNCCAQSEACAGDPACAACVESSAATCSSPAFGALQACRATCTGDPCRVTNNSGSGGAAGSGASGGPNAAGSAGTSPGGGGAGAGGASMMPPVAVESDSGCGCKVTASRPRPQLLGFALAGLCSVLLGRRRRFSFR